VSQSLDNELCTSIRVNSLSTLPTPAHKFCHIDRDFDELVTSFNEIRHSTLEYGLPILLGRFDFFWI